MEVSQASKAKHQNQKQKNQQQKSNNKNQQPIIEEKTQESNGIIPLRRRPTSTTSTSEQKKYEYDVFLIQQRNFDWKYPKGRREPTDKSDKDNAARECEEEAGLKVKQFLDFPKFEEKYSFRRNTTLIHKSVGLFMALVEGEAKIQESECRDGDWFQLGKPALDKLTHPETREICLKCCELLGCVEVNNSNNGTSAAAAAAATSSSKTTAASASSSSLKTADEIEKILQEKIILLKDKQQKITSSSTSSSLIFMGGETPNEADKKLFDEFLGKQNETLKNWLFGMLMTKKD